MPSYSPEAIELARRPVFNTNAASIFEGGKVTPTGLKAVDVTAQITLPDQIPAPTGVVTAAAITTAGTGLTNGTPKAVATTTTKGVGKGLTLDVTVSGGSVTAVTIAAGGSGYVTGDTVSINGYAGTVVTVTV